MNHNMEKDVSLLSVLSENYEAIYYVDFDENTIEPYRLSDVIDRNFGEYFRTKPSFEDAMTNYIKVMVAPEDQGEMFKRANPDYIKMKLEKKRTYAYDFRVSRGGEQLYYRMKVANLKGVGDVHQVVVGFADVTTEIDRVNQLIESKAMLKILEKDELTGLYSKEFFFKKVEQYRLEHPEQELMLWTSDILGLKVINEKYGMKKGDEVLATMAKANSFFPNFLFGGRVEGDKFSALMIDDHPDIKVINKMVQEKSPEVFDIPNVIIKHGIYHIKKNDTLTVQGMWDRSVLALQSIKNKFGKNVAEYDDKLRKDLMMSRQIMEQADSALTNKEFHVYFQPKVDTKQGTVAGSEALVRWIHPEFGFMNPGIFIPLFEQNGFIAKLDLYIWEVVCANIADWKKRGIPVVPISVNVSRYDFEDVELADKIIELVDRYEIEHELFQIEITESSYSDNPDVIQSTIKKLHDNGFNIALDDFGTGYSSMMALSSLDLDIMKLDMSIIQKDIPGTEKNVLEFSMQLAKMMNLKTVAEGVETDAQVSRIQSLGGDYIQGYYYSKPLSMAEYEIYLENFQD